MIQRKGWFKDSWRHALSARGIKSAKLKSKKRRKTKNPFDWKYKRKFMAYKDSVFSDLVHDKK